MKTTYGRNKCRTRTGKSPRKADANLPTFERWQSTLKMKISIAYDPDRVSRRRLLHDVKKTLLST